MIDALVATDVRLFSLGVLVVICGLILFAGSIYLLLSALFGKRMAYFLEAACFFGFLTILASVWTFGFWASGLDTPTNLGPRGTEPHWAPIAGGLQASAEDYPLVVQYPNDPWKEPNEGTKASVEPLATAVKEFMAEQANAEAGIETEAEIPEWAGGRGAPEYESGKVPFDPEDFTVEDVRFATQDGRSLAMARAFYNEGGPQVTVVAVHEPGNVGIYSWIFLVVGIVGFAIHVPFLDREEKRLKGIITSKPAPWRGGAQ